MYAVSVLFTNTRNVQISACLLGQMCATYRRFLIISRAQKCRRSRSRKSRINTSNLSNSSIFHIRSFYTTGRCFSAAATIIVAVAAPPLVSPRGFRSRVNPTIINSLLCLITVSHLPRVFFTSFTLARPASLLLRLADQPTERSEKGSSRGGRERERKREGDKGWHSSVCGPTLNIQRGGKKEDAFASRAVTADSRKKT